MTKTVLFYCPDINGHKLEYIHHLNERATNDTIRRYVFVVPSKFHEVAKFYKWGASPNVKFECLGEEYNNIAKSTGIKKSWYLNKSLSTYIRKHDAKWVFLIDIIPYLPFLIFQKARVAGIIYHIYPYTWTRTTFRRRILDYTRQFLLSKAGIVKRVFVLNDELGTYFFNRKFRVDKYNHIIDPVPNIGMIEQDYDLRKEYDISEDRIIMLHPGGMMKYKGTLNVLKAIEQLSNEEKKRFCFVFAGRVHEQIKDVFFNLYDSLKESSSIVLMEGYLSAERLNSLFNRTDYVLIPYEPRSQSSGIIGLSACFNKPVITTREGVVGRLVARYKLGKLLSDNTPKTIADCLIGIKGHVIIDGRKYVESHKVESFQKTIFKEFE